MLDGIKGIANNQKDLDEHFLTATEMSNIIEEAPKRPQHYLLTGSKSERINEGVPKLR